MSTPLRAAPAPPPLEDDEPVEINIPKGWENTSEDKLALRMGEAWTDARHVAAWGRWYFFDGATWREDGTLDHMTRCREFLRELSHEMAQRAGLGAIAAGKTTKAQDKAAQAAKWLRSARTVAAVVGLARSNPEQAATTEQWDGDPWLLGGPETTDLRTGETFAPRSQDYITKSAAVAPAPPGTEAPLWRKFLDRVTDGDAELESYLRRLAGYFLTGDVSEQVLIFAHGRGGNGKTVFFETLMKLLGDYATAIQSEMLMVSKSARHPTEDARLRGVRLAVGSEIERGGSWAESKVKVMTGGDRMVGRFMRQDFFEFDPQFKLCVFGNHRPSLRGVDDGIRRRLHLVPFTVKITAAERDPHLKEKLRAEWPAILRWAIDGCLEWQDRGLDPPVCVVDATRDYLAEEDAIGRWLEDRFIQDRRGWVAFAHLYESYCHWCEVSGEPALSKKKLGQELADRGFDATKRGDSRGYAGLRAPHDGGEADT